jgi:RNA polymerase sigma-70 factor (ECF subfamily)
MAKMAGVAKVMVDEVVVPVGHLESTSHVSLEALPRDGMIQAQSSDDELIQRVRAGEMDCFEELMLRHRNHVGRIVGGHVPPDQVTDLVHEVFVKTYTGLGTYRFEEPFPHWLATIAVRTCYDFWRARQAADLSVSALTTEHQRWMDQVLAIQSDESFAAPSPSAEGPRCIGVGVSPSVAGEPARRDLGPSRWVFCSRSRRLVRGTVINVKVRAHRARQLLRTILSHQIARQ